MTKLYEPLHKAVMVADSTDRETWLDARARGVGASEVHRIARGDKRAWKTILTDKLNGSTFQGNQHTRRGNEREPYLVEFLNEYLQDGNAAPNSTLFAHPDYPRHMATPDALGTIGARMENVGGEVKSHAFGKELGDIPADHFDQMQWGMWVCGIHTWYYVREVMGEDGEPTLNDPEVRLIVRDEAHIAKLAERVEAFLAWWDEGAPVEDSDLPDDFESVVEPWLAAKRAETAAKAQIKATEPKVRELIATRNGGEDADWKASSSVGGLSYTVKRGEVFDEAAWAAAEPDNYKAYQQLRDSAAELVNRATETYKMLTVTTRLTAVQPKKEAAK